MKVKELIDMLQSCLEVDEDIKIYIEGVDRRGTKQCFRIPGVRVEKAGYWFNTAIIGPIELDCIVEESNVVLDSEGESKNES